MNTVTQTFRRDVDNQNQDATVTHTDEDVSVNVLGLTLTWRYGADLHEREEQEDYEEELTQALELMRREVQRGAFIRTAAEARTVAIYLHHVAQTKGPADYAAAVLDEGTQEGRAKAEAALRHLLISHGWRFHGVKLVHPDGQSPNIVDLDTGQVLSRTYTSVEQEDGTALKEWRWLGEGRELVEEGVVGRWWSGPGAEDLLLPIKPREILETLRTTIWRTN